MEQILEDIEGMPGIHGVYYYSTTHGTIAKKTGDAFTDKDLAIVGEALVKIHSEGSKAFSDINKISLYYTEANLVIHKISNNNYLVIIHDRKLNRSLMNLTVAQALQDLKNKNGYMPEKIRQHSNDKGPASHLENNSQPDAVPEDTPLQDVLKAMETHLKQIMGPTATTIFQEALSAWEQQSTPSPETLPAFSRLIYTKMNDLEKINSYKVLIAPHLKEFD